MFMQMHAGEGNDAPKALMTAITINVVGSIAATLTSCSMINCVTTPGSKVLAQKIAASFLLLPY